MSELAYVLLTMARTLLITIVVEVPLGLLFVRERTWREAAAIALAQVVTNPAVQLACIVFGWWVSAPLASLPWLVLCIAEVVAMVVEAVLYGIALVTEHPWRMSVVTNVTSFALGLVLVSVGLP